MFGVAKATICIMSGSDTGHEIEVLFNPSEYSLDVVNEYPDTKSSRLETPISQFAGSKAPTLTMDLYFDTYTDGGGSDVSKKTGEIAKLMHDPPDVEFRWGEFAFFGVVEKVSQRFTMFRRDGVPVRAKLTVTFKGKKALSEQAKDPGRNSSDKTKRWTLTADSSIWLIAALVYGDPRHWRQIARRNGIGDPGAIRPGTPLVVPPLDSGPPGARR